MKDKYRIPANFENLNKTYLDMLIEYEDKKDSINILGLTRLQ